MIKTTKTKLEILDIFTRKYPEIIGCELEYIVRDSNRQRYILQIKAGQPYVPSYERYLTDFEIYNN